MSNIAFLFLPLAFSSLPVVLPFVSPSSQVDRIKNRMVREFGLVVLECVLVWALWIVRCGFYVFLKCGY